MPPDGPVAAGGGVIAADAVELASLSTAASAAQRQVEDVARRAGGIIGSLDGRGWDLGEVEARWASARSQFSQLSLALAAAAVELANRAALVNMFETSAGFGVTPGKALSGYSPSDMAALDAILFPPHGFQEKTYSKELQLLLNGEPSAARLARLKGKLPSMLLPTGVAVAERARQLALIGSPAGAGRKINALDKLDPTVEYEINLLNANAAVYGFKAGGANANFSAEVLAAHAHAEAGLSADFRRRRFSASFDIGAAANLAEVHAHAGEQIGGSMLGAGAGVTGDAAIGANADARAALTMDALKGKLTGDVGGDAFAGASATAEGSLEGDLGGAKTALVGSATGYAGVGVGLKADGSLDLMHGKFKFDLDAGAALGVGAKLDLGVNVDVSGVPKAIEHTAGSVVHAVSHVIPHHVKIGPVSIF